MPSKVLLDRNDLVVDPDVNAKITDLEVVGSYSWTTDFENPTTIVPGAAGQLDCHLRQTVVPLEENLCAWYERTSCLRFDTLEPALRVAHIENKIQLHEVDIVADRSVLTVLMDFVNVCSRSNECKTPFIVEMHKRTALFTAIGNMSAELMVDTIEELKVVDIDVEAFLKECRQSYVPNPSSMPTSEPHQQLLTYSFGGLSFLVRRRVDAQANGFHGSISAENSTSARTDVDDVIPSDADIQELTVQRCGDGTPDDLALEIQMCALDDDETMYNRLPSLWLSQTPWLLTARYEQLEGTRVKFAELALNHTGPWLRQFERTHQDGLKRFVAICKAITKIVAALRGPCRVSRSEEDPDVLVVERIENLETVPSPSEEMAALFQKERKRAVSLACETEEDGPSHKKAKHSK